MNREDCLTAARQAVMVDRAATHGGIVPTFDLLARLWSALLNIEVTPAQVALMMSVLKVARGWANPAHADNFIDLAGYASIAAELADQVDNTSKDPGVLPVAPAGDAGGSARVRAGGQHGAPVRGNEAENQGANPGPRGRPIVSAAPPPAE